MEFFNATSAEAGFVNTTFGENHMMAAVVARPAFRVDEGQLLFTPGFAFPIGKDVPFLTGGIDLFVVGSVWQPYGQPGTELTASIRIGERFLRRVTVVGDRRWVRENGALVPGEPEPFVSMPLSYDRAFGGAAESIHGPCAWPANPGGKGFYLSPEQAEGQPLPNLEDPDHRIRSIADQPEPMATGPYPAEGSLRVENAVEVDLQPENPGIKRIKPLVFNHAHPRMILEPANTPRPGEQIEITHASGQGSLRFSMPELEYHVHVHLEHRNYFFPLHLDRILVLLDEQRVVLGYRVVFQYRLVKREQRTVMLRQGSVPEGQIAVTQV